MISILPTLVASGLLGAMTGAGDLGSQPSVVSQETETENSWSVFADKVYTSTGATHENALVVVKDGKITAVTPGGTAPEGALRAKVVTAGLIDASARVDQGTRSVEQSNEVTPAVSMAFGVDAFDARWKRLVRDGVTTAFVPPPSRNVVGGLGVTVKTAGSGSLKERTLEGAALLCGAIGTLPSSGNSPASGRPRSFYNRRPTTRMGVEWEWRKALFEAAQAPQDGAGKDVDVLKEVLAGKVGVFIQAYTTQDIRTAVFLKEEMQREGFGEMRLIVDAAAEAWREPNLLLRSGASAVLPPMPANGRTTDAAFMAADTAKVLADAGIPFALSAHDARDSADSLGIQAGLAMRGGLTADQALRAVTITPAQLLGIDSQVGTVEVGKDADLVLWNGEPFEITSRPVGVLVNGELALDPR